MTELEFISNIVQETGAYARDRYLDRSNLQVGQKTNPNDLVTEVDIAVQRQIVDRIAQQFPGDFVLAEESGFHTRPEGRTGRCWVLDPIDGTANFVRGLFPAWGISLAFAERECTLAGGVYFPITGDLFLAERGAGATRNGRPTRTSETASLELARIELDFSSINHRYPMLEKSPEIFAKAGQLRIHGSAVAALCSVASGDMDAYLHELLNPWDYAAGVLIVEEAGGRATRYDGTPLTLFDGRNSIIASNGPLHESLIQKKT